MHKNQRLLIEILIFLIVTIGIMFPLYVHYTARQYTGAYDTLFLSGYSPYDTIVVEVHSQQNATPSNISLSILRQRISNYTGKEVMIATFPDISDEEIPDILMDDEITGVGSMVIRNHTRYHTDWLSGRIMLYIIYTDALWSGEEGYSAAGVTYNANSMMIFKNMIPDPEIETAVLIHEIGHLWDLEHSSNSSNIMNVHLDEYLISHLFNGLPNDFSEEDKEILREKHNSTLIFPIKPYAPLYSVVLNLVNTMVSP